MDEEIGIYNIFKGPSRFSSQSSLVDRGIMYRNVDHFDLGFE